MDGEPTFVSWDWRPAVVVSRSAFAVLQPGGPWVPVDYADVVHAAAVLSEEAWRARFAGEFGELDLSGLPKASRAP